VSIKRTEYGTWEVRWRDSDRRQRGKTLRTRSLAERFERQVRAEKEAVEVPDIFDPLWRKVLRSQLDDRAAIEVDGFNPNGYFVYLLWGRTEDCPLYIGASRNILARLGNHLVDPERRYLVARVTLVRCYSAEAMAATEAKLIDFYKPELNLLDGARRPIGSPPRLDRKAYALPEAAELIGVSREVLSELIEQGEIYAKRIGERTVLVPADEIRRYMNGEVWEGGPVAHAQPPPDP
jgi:excisionase family DNA binding protein